MAALRLGELLIKEGLITPSQLEQALTAQHVFGGRLGTNLVEQGFVSEENLARVLSEQLGIRMVRPHEISSIEPRVLARIPPEIARRYQVVPFQHDVDRDRLSLAIADPGNLQKLDEIQFALSCKVEFAICPEVMLAWALEKYFGLERQRRYIRVAGLAEAELELDARDRPTPQPTARKAPAATVSGSKEEMLRRIVNAPTKRDLVAATVDILSGFSGELVFFVVRGDDLLAWDARGLPPTGDALQRASLPIASAPLAADALENCRHQLVPRLQDPALSRVLGDTLFFDCSGPTFLLPLIVNRRGFGLCVMGGLQPDFAAREPLLVELMKRIAYKLQIFFLSEHLTAPL